MAGKKLEAGLTAEVGETVSLDKTAVNVGSGDREVYATPAMIALIEKTAVKALEGALEENTTSVGTRLDVKHLAATPVGMKVWAKCTLTEVDRKRLVFKVEAYDECDLIGEGIHERFIVDAEKFTAKAKSKLTK